MYERPSESDCLCFVLRWLATVNKNLCIKRFNPFSGKSILLPKLTSYHVDSNYEYVDIIGGTREKPRAPISRSSSSFLPLIRISLYTRYIDIIGGTITAAFVFIVGLGALYSSTPSPVSPSASQK